MISFTWAMSLLGVKQLENILKPENPRRASATSLGLVTRATETQLTRILQHAFSAGDRLQRSLVDSVFNGIRAGESDQPQPPGNSTEGRRGRLGTDSSSSSARARVNNGSLNTSTFIVLGEGLAAGMGDFSLYGATQRASFPAQMAQQMGADFTLPLIEDPGIGDLVGFPKLPVLTAVPMKWTVLDQLQQRPVSNLSVPGLRLHDACNLRVSQPLLHRNDAKRTAINLILGVLSIARGEDGPLCTQLECALRLKPTFSVVELGYYDALEAAVIGDPGMLPNTESFCSDYEKILISLKGSGSEVLALTIPDPIETAHFSTLEVAARILKVEPELIADLYQLRTDDLITLRGLNEIGYQLFGKEVSPLPGDALISGETAGRITSRVRELNDQITHLAKQRNALVYDLNAFFKRVRSDGIGIGTRRVTAEFLGGFYSLNGYYPGHTGHALIANELLHLLDSAYGADFGEMDAFEIMRLDPVANYRQAAGGNWSTRDLLHLPR